MATKEEIMDEENIIECWTDGMTIRQIASELGLSMLTVIECLKKNGL